MQNTPKEELTNLEIDAINAAYIITLNSMFTTLVDGIVINTKEKLDITEPFERFKIGLSIVRMTREWALKEVARDSCSNPV